MSDLAEARCWVHGVELVLCIPRFGELWLEQVSLHGLHPILVNGTSFDAMILGWIC